MKFRVVVRETLDTEYEVEAPGEQDVRDMDPDSLAEHATYIGNPGDSIKIIEVRECQN